MTRRYAVPPKVSRLGEKAKIPGRISVGGLLPGVLEGRDKSDKFDAGSTRIFTKLGLISYQFLVSVSIAIVEASVASVQNKSIDRLVLVRSITNNFIHVVVFDLHLNSIGHSDIYSAAANSQPDRDSSTVDLVGNLDDSASIDWGNSDLE